MTKSSELIRTRIVVHDYSGHPGQAQLSRTLASHGYSVTHQHCPSYTTGKGSLERLPGDPPLLAFEACPMRGTFKRYQFVRRLRQERLYGRNAAHRILAHRPDAVVLSNVPLLAHVRIARTLRRRRIPMVFWHQDIYSAAIAAHAHARLGSLGRPLAWIADRLERKVARSSAAIVAISPSFMPKLTEWGVAKRATVVPNWAPVAELPQLPKRNEWSRKAGLADVPVVLYAGTLGLKHDPSVLALMADALSAHHPEARLVVVSEGSGRDWLEEWMAERKAKNVLLLDYQPYENLPAVLATADVLVAVLEGDASRYSVPSKVLTYMCAGRAILGVMPHQNSVAELLTEHGSGVIVDPGDRAAIGTALTTLLDDDEGRARLGMAARTHAGEVFPPERACAAFEAIFESLGIRA